MAKIRFNKARVSQTSRFVREGSVLAGTISGRPVETVTFVDIESDEPEERVRQLLQMAEQSCFTLQSLLTTVPIRTVASLNGAPLDQPTGG